LPKKSGELRAHDRRIEGGRRNQLRERRKQIPRVFFFGESERFGRAAVLQKMRPLVPRFY